MNTNTELQQERTSAETGGMQAHAKALFEDSVERLDAHTRSRLTQARCAALEELRKTSPLRSRWVWAPAGGVLAVALVALFIGPWVDGGPGAGAALETLALEDLDIIAEGDSMDLLRDVEFYAWLAQQPQVLDDQGSG